MLRTVDEFRLGLTSKAQAEAALSKIGLETEDEACSMSEGPCQGIAFGVASFPQPSSSLFSRVISFSAGRISLFRPTALGGNFYFVSDHLEMMKMDFQTERSGVGVVLASTATGMGEDYVPGWQHNYRNGSDNLYKVIDSSHQSVTSLDASRVFNLNCLESMRGCNSNDKLLVSTAQH